MKECEQGDGKFSLPLHLRTPDKEVPSNQSHVLQRAPRLKKKLAANPKMFEEYKTFMDTILVKGYAKVSKLSPKPNKTWYIPHHGVYILHHGVYLPHKPDKIRVVFDCSLEYKNYCLNKELLQGTTILSWRSKTSIDVELLQRAEQAILRMNQRRNLWEEIDTLTKSPKEWVKKGSSLIKLSTFLDEHYIRRVGGRIQNSDVTFHMKHPIILPRRCITTNLLRKPPI